MNTILLILTGLFAYWLLATVCEKIGDFIDFCSEKIAKMQGKKSKLHFWNLKKDKREKNKQKQWNRQHLLKYMTSNIRLKKKIVKILSG